MSANRSGAAPGAAPVTVPQSRLAPGSPRPGPPACPRRRPRAAPRRRRPAPAALLRGDTLARLPLDLLQRGRYQPRIDMRPETLEDLANSIRAQGVIQPVVVRPVGPAGRRRRHRALRNHRRRAPLARRPDRRPRRDSRRHPPRAGRGRDRDGADREHPARGPEPARGGPRPRPADPRIRGHPPAGRRRRRPLAGRRQQPAAPARPRARGGGDGRETRAGDGPRARAARPDHPPPAGRSRRIGREEGSFRPGNRGIGSPAGQSGRRRDDGGCGRARRATPTSSSSRNASPTRSAPRSRSSIRLAAARARWSSATTPSTSSTASWPTSH